MSFIASRASFVRPFLIACAAAAALLLSGCATSYLDGAVKDVPDSQFAKPAQLQPVQVVVEFQTNGKPNARATDFVKPMVMERIKASGLFSDVQDKPNGGALLSVQINNVALIDDAYKKGFLTGLTFGIKGSTVTDGYVCTVSYSRGQSAAIVKTSKHAIHTSMGSGGDVPGGVKAASTAEAVTIMVRQIVGVALKDLSDDPAFK
ncbi:hypothetical protein [Ramlibacter sp. PS4R-6]|uniref:hypothetical protein n=1 Tax=Ramlibacter sp. PS4R-6 TaxID=3133438 RepID=UPI0030A2672E